MVRISIGGEILRVSAAKAVEIVSMLPSKESEF